MSKRFLRGRTILLPDSDAEVCKRKKREPFPFEDLPSEFYNIVLEKMPLRDFEMFNFGSKFTARICEEFELRDGPFDLEELPVELHSTIVEKLPFKDLTMFNLGSRLTVEMCEDLKEIEAPVEKVCVQEEGETVQASWETAHRDLDQVPEKVRLRTEILEIAKNDLTAIVKYKIRAYEVKFNGDTGADPEFVKEVLMFTRPEEVYFDSTSPETLKLEELKKMKQVAFIPWDFFGDRDLLAIDLESFTMGPWLRNVRGMRVTSQGVLQLLQEWRAGTRRIKKIEIIHCRLNKQLILNEFPGHPQEPSRRMILCKGDGETDCIVTYGDARQRDPLILAVKVCEGEGKAYPNIPVFGPFRCGTGKIRRRH